MRRLAAYLILTGCAWAAPPGLPNSDYPVHALTHAKIYVTPDKVLEDATLIIENGKIRQVGAGLEAPAGARVWNCQGKVIHAGFVEPFLGDQEAENEADEEKAETSGNGDQMRAAGGASDDKSDEDNPPARAAEREVQKDFSLSAERMDKLRGLGILTFQVVPQKGILRGQGAIYTLKTDKLEEDLLKTATCQVIGLRSLKGQPQAEDFPSSLMGNLSLIRQSFRKARWAATQNPTGPSPSWAALEKARAQNLNFYFEGRNLLESDSLKRLLVKVENLPLIWVTTPDAVLQPDWLSGRLILTLDYPKLELHAARRPDISYAQAASWRSAPALGKQVKNFCYSIHRLDEWEKYPERLLQVKTYGLSEAELLDALTRRPAQWLGLSDLGTLEAGKSATLVVRKGSPFEGAVEQVWVQGLPRRVSEDHQHKTKAGKLPQSPAYEAEPKWQPNGSVLIHNATVWTQGPKGKVDNCDVLIQAGKIANLGSNLSAPAGVPVIEAQGLHLLPGIIDAHSHTAVLGDVNEDTETVTAQVDIADVLQPLDPQILNQLAGGVTCAHVLHGSANSIGGRTVTVKWRWGARAEQLPMAGALPGIKFALGENVKQSNWGDTYTSRYPQTRLGVAALIRQRFLEAQKYRQLPHPEPDEAMETLLEILDGKRLVHCHSYRQDEILMLLRVAEEMHFKIATLQHGLEAYKVADQIAAHGAGVSTFSDWWAYKLEVRDAIPYNGPLLKERGVTVSYNSDSDELARRLLGEAAKAVRYGDLKEQESLDFLTLNPARQLKISDRVGSLEIGKDGDCALWSGPPFAPNSRCLRTWVDGTQVFERESYQKRQAELRSKRQQWLDEAVKKDKDDDEK